MSKNSETALLNKFNALSADKQAAILGMIDVLGTDEDNAAPVISRRSGKGLESKPAKASGKRTVADDEDAQQPKKRGPKPGSKRTAKGETETAPKRRAAKAEPAKPAKAEKPAPAKASAGAVDVSLYGELIAKGKNKGEKQAYTDATIKKIEKIVANDRTWQDEHARAQKKGVEVKFGRGKPSEARNKRMIGIALANADKL
jgi:hypothetical protein